MRRRALAQAAHVLAAGIIDNPARRGGRHAAPIITAQVFP